VEGTQIITFSKNWFKRLNWASSPYIKAKNGDITEE
jgi:hypothetical protein